ncbi:MAG: AMP-binding protein [Spirochaetota bacterium]|nr:AMP-binding protein [Spirochaetota bacterium]
MKLEYKTLKDAQENFTWSERWEIFDKDRDHLNIAYECVDRHPKDKIGIRIKYSDRRTETYTFGEISRWSSQFANMLERYGVKKGDRVGLIMNPSLEYYVSFFGTLKRGAVAVPCYALLGPDGIEYRIKDSHSQMAIISRERIDVVKPELVEHLIACEDLMDIIKDEDDSYTPDTSAETLALIQFSSGTTGQPKQVLYKHAAMTVTTVFAKFWLGLREDDRYMCTSSPAWGHGIWYGTVGPMVIGAGIGVCSGKFEADILLEAMEEFEVTVVSVIPRVYKVLMESGIIDNYNLKFRRLTYTGSKIDTEVQQYFLDKFGIFIGGNYGNTESGPIVIDFPFPDYTPRIGSSGKPMIGVKMGILDDDDNELPTRQIGQVAVWRKDKWNPIGDYGFFDEDGYFWPQGRSDDVIKSSGYRIGPFEIENVLEKHPSVQKAAVVGSPHEERGELVKAFIILESSTKPSEELVKEIQDFVKERLSMHEYPKLIEFVDQVPETPDGKLKRKELKRMEYEKMGVKLI